MHFDLDYILTTVNYCPKSIFLALWDDRTVLVWNTELCFIDSKCLSFYFVFFPTVKGRLFEVKELFLEDILKLVGFRNKDMLKHDEEAQKSTARRSVGPSSVASIFQPFSSLWVPSSDPQGRGSRKA